MVAYEEVAFCVVRPACLCVGLPGWQAAPIAKSRLENLQQLTHGGENAEAYWAPDGKRLIFQSTRDGHDCDQQYIMNADGSDQHLVSTRQGRDHLRILPLRQQAHSVRDRRKKARASCPAKPDRSKGYLWAVYPTWDIYLAEDNGKIVKKLTDTPGYDAEATINWKNQQIIYTSMASGDLDVWSMNEDGSDKKQLTKTEGYDGGAVFSRDGSQMVWRAYRPDTPEKLETVPVAAEGQSDRADEDGVVRGQFRRLRREADHQFRLRQLRPHLHAGRQEDSVRLQQASLRQQRFRAVPDQYRRHRPGAGDQLRRIHFVSRIFRRTERSWRLLSSYQGKSEYEFNVFTADWK